jgi:SAM-dependent methyltransferase
MAISHTHYLLLRALREQNILPQGGRILEIGQANWYGDGGLDELRADRDRWGGFDESLSADLESTNLFTLARMAYDVLFKPNSVVAIDAGGEESALRYDLNCFGWEPSDARFDISVNHGTAEHVFNIGNVFRVMHEAVVPGGLMFHESPFTGWVDHGFYCLQPTLFFDLARVNGYDIVLMATEHLASKTARIVPSREYLSQLRRQGALNDDLMLFVAFRKTSDEPFRWPIQGVYDGALSEQGEKDWKELRGNHKSAVDGRIADDDGFVFPRDVEGWLSEKEGKALWRLARDKSVLEFGSYCGRSTVCMAQAASRVVSIDPFNGTATPQPGDTFAKFQAALQAYGVSEKVLPLRATTDMAFSEVTATGDQFDLVFIDGAHDLDSVKFDLDFALQMLAPGGLIAFHDYRTYSGEFDGRWDPGVTKAVDEFVASGAELVARHDSLAVVRPPRQK